MNVVFVHSTLPEDQYRVHIRCHNPATALQSQGRHTVHLLSLEEFASNHPRATEYCTKADVIILHRYLFEKTLAAVARWRGQGKRVLVDLDLGVEYLEVDRPGYAFWHKGILPAPFQNDSRPIYPPPAEQLKWLFKMVDGVLVSTPQLARDYFPFGRVQVLADFVNINEYLIVPPQKDENVVWLGLNISGQSLNSLRQTEVLEGLQRAFQQSDSLNLLLAGGDCSPAYWFHDFPRERVTVFPNLQPAQVATVLGRVDVGLVPAWGEFDVRQSPLPLVEYMAMKVPWIASNTPAFQGLAKYGYLVDHSAVEWAAAILRIVGDLQNVRQQAAGAPYLYALSQDASENIDQIERALRAFEEAN